MLFASFCVLYVGYSLSAQKMIGKLNLVPIGYGLAVLGGVLSFAGITSVASLLIIFTIFFFPFVFHILRGNYFVAALTGVAGIAVGMLVRGLVYMFYKRRTVLLALLLSVCLLSSVGSFYVQNQQLRWEHQYQILTMRNSFMEPTLKTGDLLVVDTRRPAHITAAPKEADVPGDIIAFPDPRPDHRLRELFFFVSRVVEKFQVDETWYFHTKGDASSGSSYDPWGPVPGDWILGKVVDVNPLVIVLFAVRTDQQMLRSHWTTWLLLVAATAVGTGLASLLIFMPPPSRKQQAAPS